MTIIIITTQPQPSSAENIIPKSHRVKGITTETNNIAATIVQNITHYIRVYSSCL
jgi:hypothetical protein